MSLAYNGQLTHSQERTINAHYNTLVEIIDLDEPWEAVEFEDGPSNSLLGTLKSEGIIQEVGKGFKDGDRYRRWQFADAAREKIEAIRDEQTGPCDHRGVVNLGGEYTCSAEFCNQRFGRDTAAKIMQGVTA